MDHPRPAEIARRGQPGAMRYAEAVRVFGFRPDPTAIQVRVRFLDLAKRHQPDKTCGDHGEDATAQRRL